MPLIWKLKSVMDERNLNYTELAELTGMHSVTVNRLSLHPPKRFEQNTLELLCAALNCQPGDLIQYSQQVETYE